MKDFKIFLSILIILLSSCYRKNLQDQDNIIPVKFKIDIPQSLSNANEQETKVHSEDENILGPRIYRNLRNFIYIGEFASNIIQGIFQSINKYNLSQEITFSYTSREDGRIKDVVVNSNVQYENRHWQFKMTITDVEIEEEDDDEDKGIALVVYWNTDPVEGIALIKFKNLNANINDAFDNTMFRIEYSENSKNTMGYDEIMRIFISDWANDETNRYCMKNLMMFVGRKGSRVDVYGNSDHPYAWLLIQDNQGLNWAFVASANINKDIAVAEIGLPPRTLNSSQRSVLLEQYSIKNVLTNEINEWFYAMHHFYPNSEQLAFYLQNAEAPGMFNRLGFVQGGGTPPSPDYNELIDAIKNLSPFNPYTVANLSIEF